MNINPKYVQLAGDALIPLCGFFLWEWSLYFILLFYFIDMIADEFFLHLKSNKIVKSQGAEYRSAWLKLGIVSFFSFLLSITLIHFSMMFIEPDINFKHEAIAFWNYEEMGVKQGVLLFPLVFVVGYMQFRMEFLLPGVFRKANIEMIWKKHVMALIAIIALSGFCLALSQFIILPELVYVLIVVVGTSAYKLRFN
ncbi:MAG: hypothetical protein ACPGVI_03035 [Crocinitomicaceae bacterium]|jgi:hypothetical protein